MVNNNLKLPHACVHRGIYVIYPHTHSKKKKNLTQPTTEYQEKGELQKFLFTHLDFIEMWITMKGLTFKGNYTSKQKAQMKSTGSVSYVLGRWAWGTE